MTDFLQHMQHLLIGATVQGAVQPGRRGGHGNVGIGQRTAHAAHRVGTAVLFVVHVQDENHVQRFFQHGIR